ncbi:unnamed protein product [Brachionus calyciflorus]|uniref:Uncharacterized protein n=1 Tax=Brachionus calyciflorus TaxID=104777 RepID=A0A813PRB8_9BILA|nr:unnamed protein product [Brachionus calyciflorus]
MLKFSCTDRLKETKNLEKKFEIETNLDKKEYNTILIEKLKDFQVEVNSLLTEFVEKEKKAIASKELSNDHLKELTKSKTEDVCEESSEESESECDENLKRNTENTSTDLNEPAEKKPCIETGV